jgi:hypothetical protein
VRKACDDVVDCRVDHIVHPIPCTSIEYRQLIEVDTTSNTWLRAAGNECGHLAQGVGNRIEGSNTIHLIPWGTVPPCKTVTYGRFVVDIYPNKPELRRVRLAVGDNLIQYHGDVATRAADLTTSKCLWNIKISIEGGKYMCLDVKNFYMGTPMDEFESKIILLIYR